MILESDTSSAARNIATLGEGHDGVINKTQLNVKLCNLMKIYSCRFYAGCSNDLDEGWDNLDMLSSTRDILSERPLSQQSSHRINLPCYPSDTMQLPKAAFLPPVPLLSSSFICPSNSPRPSSCNIHRAPHLTSLKTPISRAAPPATPRPVQLHPEPPQIIPYPTPSGVPGQRAKFVSTCPSIPSVFSTMASDPDFSDRLALVDDHHTPSAHLTFADLSNLTAKMARGLKQLGLGPRDVISYFSENSHRWLVTDLAIMSVGAAAAVRGVAAPVPELMYIYQHSRSVALVVENVAMLDKVVAAGLDRANVRFVIVLFGSVESYHDAQFPVFAYDEVIEKGQDIDGVAVGQSVERDDVATVLYTSGTTGNPKGVPLTHDNLLSQLADISLGKIDPLPGEIFLSILPCWHVFERTAIYWVLSKGNTYIYSNKRRFRDDLIKYRPHLLISVPRVFENLHVAIMSKLESASAVRRAIFGLFYALSLSFVKARRRLFKLDIASASKRRVLGKIVDVLQFTLLFPLYLLAERLVWRKIRERLGGRVRTCLSGGGSIAGYLEDFFECVGFTICVGYGMTETSPVIANRFGEHNVRGSTGMTLPRAYVKIVNKETREIVKQGEQGTLFVAGPYVFSGYLKDPEATAKAFDSEGYFDTGDLAYNTLDGDVVITGRGKDLIVLSNGENIEPAAIEDAVLASPLIDQIMLVGQDQRSLGALVVPKLDYLEHEGLVDSSYKAQLENLLKDPKQNATELRKHEVELLKQAGLKEALSKDIKDLNQSRPNFSAVDKVDDFRLVLVPFTVENGMATQTLKIKKSVVNKIYEKEIAELYYRSRT